MKLHLVLLHIHAGNGLKTVESSRVTKKWKAFNSCSRENADRTTSSLLFGSHLSNPNRVPSDPGSWTILHDNAPAHTATLSTRYYNKNKITVIIPPALLTRFRSNRLYSISETQVG